MPRKTEEPKPKRVVVRQRNGTIDPRRLEEEKLHAERFLEKVQAEVAALGVIEIAAYFRLRQIKALMNLPTLDIPNEGE